MTQMTDEQKHRLEQAARSVDAKLQAFRDGLSPDEQSVLDAALWLGLRGSDDPLDDVAGNSYSTTEFMASLKLMGEILSNVSRTRSEISMTFARNARA